jgi:hypothetical protein
MALILKLLGKPGLPNWNEHGAQLEADFILSKRAGVGIGNTYGHRFRQHVRIHNYQCGQFHLGDVVHIQVQGCSGLVDTPAHPWDRAVVLRA